MYLSNPSARVGSTWGQMPKAQQELWVAFECDNYKHSLADVRSKAVVDDAVQSGSLQMSKNKRTALQRTSTATSGGKNSDGGSKQQIIVFTVASLEMVSMTNNWLCSLRPYATREHRVVLRALDAGVCAALEAVLRTFAEGAATCIEDDDARPVDDTDSEQKKRVRYQGKNYLRNTRKKLPIFARELEQAAPGTWYLFCDIDLVFVQSPFAYLQRVPKKTNFLFQQSPKYCPQNRVDEVVQIPNDKKVLKTGSELVCTGLFYVHAKPETVALLHKGISLLSTSFDGADQGAINMALASSGTDIQMLLCHEFPNGNNFFSEEREGRTPVAVHFNYFYKSEKKAMCMRETGMWVHDAKKAGASICGNVQLPLKRSCSCWMYNRCR
eukprot:g1591.t1